MPFWSREENEKPQEPVGSDHSTSDGIEAAPEVDRAASDSTASESPDGHPGDSGFPQDPETDASAGDVREPDWPEPEEGSSDHPLAGEPVGFDNEPADGSATGDWAATGDGAADAVPDPADSESFGGNVGERPLPPPGDVGELPASGSESDPATGPYGPVTDSSLGTNGDSVAAHVEPESDASSTDDLPGASRGPSAPDDRIRELFRQRQAAANSSATKVAPSAAAEPVRDGHPESPRQAAQPAAEILPLEESKGRLSRFIRRRAKGEKSEAEGSVSASPRTGRKTKPVAPELLPWEPRGAAFRVKQFFKGRRVTISLEPDAMRVVVSKGREIIAWGSVQVENPALVGDEPGEKPAERLKALLADLGAGRSRVITDLPLNAALTRHMQLPKMRGRYIEQVVLSELQDTTPFALDEMDLTWQARNNGTDHDILAVATSRETIDNHVRAMAEAGVQARGSSRRLPHWRMPRESPMRSWPISEHRKPTSC